MAEVIAIDGKARGSITMPPVFSEAVRPDLIRRAVLAENTRRLQPQGHSTLAGMQTSAAYFGAMNSYRSGRHMGVAIRPKEKMGGGVQGKVKRIPSATKGRRAHPHKTGKIIVELINRKEYQKAMASAAAATASYVAASSPQLHTIVVANDIESVKRTRELMAIFKSLNLYKYLNESNSPHIRKGLRRSGKIRRYSKRLLIVVGKESAIIRAARNIPGVDICSVGGLTANLLAPGGNAGRLAIWSESAVNELPKAIEKMMVR